VADTPDLEAILRERGGHAYIVTVTEQGGPHAIYVPVHCEQDSFIAEVGAKTADYAAARPQVSLLYPVRAAGDYSLIVDGTATVESAVAGPRLRVSPTRIVLHRSEPGPDSAAGCGADCVPLPIAAR
jgi:hypothetical protein